MESSLDTNLIIFLLLGTLVVILLVVAIIFFVFKYHHKILQKENTLQEEKLVHQQQLIQATLLAEEKEKERLSKNVHDEMGTYASLLKMNVSRLTLLPNQDEHIKQLLTEQKSLITDMTSFVRNISMELSSPTVKDFGLIAGIEELITVIEKNTSIKFSFHYSEVTNCFDLNTETQLLRTIKELLNNLIKHAQPNDVAITFVYSKYFVKFTITHDGAGISSTEYEKLLHQSTGLGLKSIETRIQSLSGTIDYIKEDSNYLIQLKIPINHV